MLLQRKWIVIAGMAVTVFAGLAATKPGCSEGLGDSGGPGDPASPAYTNLKVLPKNISSKQLSRIMVDQFGDELGVSCSFCHAENKETGRPDYASDEKPEKQIARSMMRMTLELNKKFFHTGHIVIGDSTQVITCGTCHHGQPHPDTAP